MANQTTLISLAMLKAHIDQGGDYLNYLHPFIMQILGQHEKTKPVKTAQISDNLKTEYGLIIPDKSVQIVLQRIIRKGYIKKENKLYWIKKEIPTDFTPKKAETSRHISSVLNSLIDYAKSLGKEITEKVAVDAIVAFLSQFSMECLKYFIYGTALPPVDNSGWKIFLVSRYIKYINEKSPEKFDSFIVLVKGNMLANALLCPDLKHSSHSCKNVQFFIDTSLLLRLIGLDDEHKTNATKQLIKLIKKQHGNIACFDHTLAETVNAIQVTANNLDSPDSYGSIKRTAQKSGMTKSDLILLAQKVEEKLSSQGIRTISTPDYVEQYQIDEPNLEKILQLHTLSSYKEGFMRNDVNSIRAIYVIRKGDNPIIIENCKAILITSNIALAKAASEYGRNAENSQLSSVITDFSLANILWLKSPQEAPELPRKEVIAFAYAALDPPEAFFLKVTKIAAKLEEDGEISARNHQLLRSSIAGQERLYETTSGEDAALNKENISETIEYLTEEIKKEERKELSKEQSEHERTKSKLSKITKKVIQISQKLSTILAVITTTFTIVIVPVLGWFVLQLIGLEDRFLDAGLIIVTLLSLYNGITVLRIYKNIQTWMRFRIHAICLNLFGIDVDSKE